MFAGERTKDVQANSWAALGSLRFRMEAAPRPEPGEVKLLRAVLLRALADLRSTGSVQREALVWLKSDACATVCQILDLPYATLRARLETDGSLKGIFPRCGHRSPLARLRRCPQHAAAAYRRSTPQGLARLRAVRTGGTGGVRLRTQEFPGARASGWPVRKSWGGRFKSPGRAQRLLSAFGLISQHFRLRRHRFAASAYRQELWTRFQVW
jgi:hypothetical protein